MENYRVLIQIIMIAVIIVLALLSISILLKLIIPSRQRFIQELLKTKDLQKDLYTDLNDQVSSIEALKNLIEKEIVEEIQYTLKDSLYLRNTPYKVLNLDTDANSISLRVYNSLKPELFKNMADYSPIYNDEYWMNYIIKRTTVNILMLISSGSILTK